MPVGAPAGGLPNQVAKPFSAVKVASQFTPMNE